MRYLQLSDLPRISRIGLGTWQFGSREWGYGEQYAQEEAGRLVRRALDLGVTLVDTAEVYGLGRSERIVGAALAGVRERAFVATKILPLLPVGPVVAQRARASARRLGVSRLDLYQVHLPNPVVPDAATMAGMRTLHAAGLVGEVGVSNYSLARWQHAERAYGARVLSNQVQYSLVARGPDRALIPYASAHDRLVIAYSPLGQGLLSGRYDVDHRPSGRIRALNPLFLPDNLERARPLVGTLRDIASTHDATPAQVALAWTIHHPNVVAIPGASSPAQVESNAAAADLVLTGDEYAELTQVAEQFQPVTGAAALPRLVAARLRRS